MRHALLGAVLALPLALLALSLPPGGRMGAVLSALPLIAGLVALDHVLRQRVSAGTAFWTTVLAAYATPVFPLLAHAPHAARAVAFLLGAIGLVLVPRWPGSPRARRFFLLALALGFVCSARNAPATLDLARALFGSREGLLFWTPLLWGSLAGAVVLYRREGRAGVHLVGTALLPFAAAAFFDRIDVALPAMLVALGVALEALSRLVQRRPAWALAAVLPLLAVSNLLFMEQYRHTLKRDDTVSFPQVSEGNARLLSRGLGSPNAWPANWIWSARHDLPVERWDLLSGQRLDPGHGATIDVGDLEQDAAFLLSGWSVRHACADAVCREVEGRAEIVIPLERAAYGLILRASGPGALRVTLNGRDLGTVALAPDLGDATVRAGHFRLGRLNRVVLEPVAGTRALVDRVSFIWGER